MPETNMEQNRQQIELVRHRGRLSQIRIYLGKFLRMFIYQNDWKVLPMAAVIAGLVAMVTQNSFFLTMEGTLMGAFILSCIAIWNGCFNSIQVICRERDVIKREHRSGMHISSYVIAHLIYQAALCLLQTIITMYVFRLAGVQFPGKALFTRWSIMDVGITVFFITFAADALALWISSLARNTTVAMTIMPFILIFQLVFSGVMIELPEWSRPLQNLTISQYGVRSLNAQADYNELPLVSLWWTLVGMRDSEVTINVTANQVLDYLSDEQNPGAQDLREMHFSQTMTVRELADLMKETDVDSETKALLSNKALLALWGDEELNISFTLGEVIDTMADNPAMQDEREQMITVKTTIGEIMDTLGQDKVYQAIQDTAAASKRNQDYDFSRTNVASCWALLFLAAMASAVMATITLEFIDKDKR